MRIVEAKTYIVGNPWKNWVFVRLETDEGIYGIGEGTLNGFAKTTEACIRELRILTASMPPLIQQSGNKTGPPCLMRCTQACTIVTVEVLIEQQMVPPMGVVLELLCPSKDRTAAVVAPSKERDHAVCDLAGDLSQLNFFSIATWHDYLKRIAVGASQTPQ
jgi:mandelate racemase/muconate lactonizing enzyme-like protein